jgi:hypothetical protein
MQRTADEHAEGLSIGPRGACWRSTTAKLSRGDAEDLVDEINVEENLYKILGVKRRAKTDEVKVNNLQPRTRTGCLEVQKATRNSGETHSG